MYQIKIKSILADNYTPVSIYQKVRNKYPKSILLESSDYHSKSDSYSIIAFHELANISCTTSSITITKDQQITSKQTSSLTQEIHDFKKLFNVQHNDFAFSGIYGFTSFDAVENFEPTLKNQDKSDLPTVSYSFYKYLFVFNHFNDELLLVTHYTNDEEASHDKQEEILRAHAVSAYPFQVIGGENGFPSKQEFENLVAKGIEHCLKGDVFQVVLSRQFQQKYQGDEFEVYRRLRSINPSPYLFFFDLGNFSLMGSSPEAHLKITNQQAEIHPIAGTYLRTGNDLEDMEKAAALLSDHKENAEHTMLVDLARNDLNRFCNKAEVTKLKELQFFSHVIHMVSRVEGKLEFGTPEELMASTFPAGTLSGAPKIKALELIQQYETTKRSFYGGAIGLYAFNGDLNHAIIIRSILAKEKCLYYQAGAGIVAKSKPKDEAQEVDNKIKACRTAIQMAQQ